MSQRRDLSHLLAFVLSVSVIASVLSAILVANLYQNIQFEMLGTVCRAIIEDHPETEQTVFTVLKGYKNHSAPESKENILSKLGYHSSDFGKITYKQVMVFAVIGLMFGGILFFLTFWYRHKKETLRIQALVDYLEQVNNGRAGLLLQSGEDNFSKLQDEIYKTVTMLYQMQEAALEAKEHFAKNLSNIAHQLKTPITAISLSTQMLRGKAYPCADYPEQIQRQLTRLTYLEEALLVLARIDSGTLTLEKKAVDVFTILTLAADNLQELFDNSDVSVMIPELGEMRIFADFDWTIEAVMNLMKNCMEHTPSGGTVHCFYEENPIYTVITIWDEGTGFAKEDISHLFERFYRGQNAIEGGIGIGLPLAKEIIERQNGTIRAGNLPSGGGRFEIRFYCH